MIHLFLTAFLIVIALVPAVSFIAKRIGLVDNPGGRKLHKNSVPLTGGICICLAFLAVSIIGWTGTFENWSLYTGIIALVIIGAFDDYQDVNAWLKFFIHIAVAVLAVVFGGVQLKTLGNLFSMGDFNLGFMAIPFCLAAVVLLMNAINLMDGLDGLAGGQCFVILFWLAVACVASENLPALITLILLLGILAGFLVYNLRIPFRKRASVFLGDAGSITLGFIVAWFSIMLAKQDNAGLQPMTVAWILALPIYDTCAQFYRRVKEGKHPFSADRGHFHHHFIEAGWSVRAAVYAILTISIILGAIGYGGQILQIPPIILTLTWICFLLAHMEISRKPERYIKLFMYVRQSMIRGHGE